MRMRCMWLCAVAFVSAVLASTEGRAAVMNAASCGSADVQAAINGARDGDTVVVPTGSCAWTTTVVMKKAVKLTASGPVRITNNMGGGADMLQLTESPNGRAELAGFTFEQGKGTNSYHLRVKFATGGKAVLVHDNTFSYSAPDGAPRFFIRWETNRGVFWNNMVTAAFPIMDNAVQTDPFGNSWQTASTMGTADTTGENNIYFEHNTFRNFIIQAFDISAGSRNVIRYNTIINSAIGSHGKETGPLGHRHTEVYNNTFMIDNPNDGYCPGIGYLQNWINLRGGTLVVTKNTMPDVPARCGGAYGARPAITLVSQNLHRRYNNQTPASGIIANPCWGADSPPALAPNQVWPVPQQIGQSNDGTRTPDSYGSTSFTDPVYVWNNTGSPTVRPENWPGNECGANAKDVSGFIQLNRDYVLGAKPGYTPYPYPHPLTSSSVSLPRPSSLTVK